MLDIADYGIVYADAPAMFPAAAVHHGEIVVAFSTVPDGWPGGRVCVTRSDDEGRTWSPCVVVAEPSDDGSDANVGADGLMALRDGTLLLPYNSVRWTPGGGLAGRLMEARLKRSVDGGRTWSVGAAPSLRFHSFTAYGRLIERSDGTLAWPVWGQLREGERWRSALLESSDHGETWDVGATIAYDPNARITTEYAAPRVGGIGDDGRPSISATTDPHFRPHSPIDGYNETSLLVNADRWCAMIRQQGVDGDQTLQLYEAESYDSGTSWTRPSPAGFAGMSPVLHCTSDGREMVAYRARAAEETPASEPGVELRARCAERTWSAPVRMVEPLGFRYSAEYQCGYPTLVNLAGGDLLVIFYSFRKDVGRYLVWNRIKLPVEPELGLREG